MTAADDIDDEPVARKAKAIAARASPAAKASTPGSRTGPASRPAADEGRGG